MPLKKICPLCNRIIDAGTTYCKECTDKRQQFKADNNRYYDKHKRNKRNDIFYHSDEWKATRQYVINNYKGLDIYAYYINNEVVYAEMVHHIIEVEEDWNRRLDITNLFPLSNKNHNVIGAMYLKDKKGTQAMLFDLLARWDRETKRVGGYEKSFA